MREHMTLKGLRINDQPFLAPSRALVLASTACPAVLKLTWPVWHELRENHLRWLLNRLRALGTTPQPWWWTSTNPDPYRTPVRFRAWLVSPIGYDRHASGRLMRAFFLHLHLAPDGAALGPAPLSCPAQCTHTGLRDTQVHRPIGSKDGPQRERTVYGRG
jgi:hypothetical protein